MWWTRQILASLLVALACMASAQADDYPSRPIRLIVGYAPGGSVDITARIVADKLSQALGQQVFVDNRPGGGTIIASQQLLKAAPDGYTLMLADIAHTANPALHAQLPYDTLTAFKPIILAVFYPSVLVVNKTLPVSDLKEFIEYAKKNDGKLNYSSAGIGGMNYLGYELFNKQAGVHVIHIPYQSGGQAVSAVVSGFVQTLLTTAPPVMAFRDKIKILAVSSDKRLPALPEVPTFAQAGMPQFKVQLWQGLLAPAGINEKIVVRLNQEVNTILQLPDVRERISKLGGNVVGGTPSQFQAFISEETSKWQNLIPASARVRN
jgi:tripartite-type tricarboxylate transporter receptor subunit TctC